MLVNMEHKIKTKVQLLALLIATIVRKCGAEESTTEFPGTDHDEYPYKKLQGRIVGGVQAERYELPYQLAILLPNGFCGGTLVELYDVQFAITAAHCVWRGYPLWNSTIRPKLIYIIAGGYDTENLNGEEQQRKPKKISMHEGFTNPNNFKTGNDLALIFYEPPFIKRKGTWPINLPGAGWKPPPWVTISGWGAINRHLHPFSIVRKVTMYTISNYECLKHDSNLAADREFCVMSKDGLEKGSCSGDSGGPVVGVNPETAKMYIYGVVAYHINECGEDVSVYTLLPFFMKWVSDRVNDYRIETGRPAVG